MTAQRDKKRTPPISIRLTREERAELERRVALCGLSRNAYVKSRLFGESLPRASRRPGIEKKLVVELLAAAARVQDQLHDIALAGGAKSSVVIEQAREDLLEIRAALFAALGRK
jgi:hypothetical protein